VLKPWDQHWVLPELLLPELLLLPVRRQQLCLQQLQLLLPVTRQQLHLLQLHRSLLLKEHLLLELALALTPGQHHLTLVTYMLHRELRPVRLVSVLAGRLFLVRVFDHVGLSG
jgi:hypothetical protein